MNDIKSVEENMFWKTVSDDLGIEIEAPFALTAEDGTMVAVSALVKNFGPERGMIIIPEYDIIKPHKKFILESGYGYSTFRGVSSSQYNRNSIIEMLRDWGWSGPDDERPDWFSVD